MNTILDNHSIAIVGTAGTGKTTVLKRCFEEIRAKQKVKTISINCSDSELVWLVDEVVKNKVPSNAAFDGSGLDIEMLDVSWQDIELEDHTSQVSVNLMEILIINIIMFVEKSDVPCVILIEEFWQLRQQEMSSLMRLFDTVVQRGGYFLFTTAHIDVKGIDLFLDKVEQIIDLGSYGVYVGSVCDSRETPRRMELYRNTRGEVELGSRIDDIANE